MHLVNRAGEERPHPDNDSKTHYGCDNLIVDEEQYAQVHTTTVVKGIVQRGTRGSAIS